jgi:hypothetical protein
MLVEQQELALMENVLVPKLEKHFVIRTALIPQVMLITVEIVEIPVLETENVSRESVSVTIL